MPLRAMFSACAPRQIARIGSRASKAALATASSASSRSSQVGPSAGSSSCPYALGWMSGPPERQTPETLPMSSSMSSCGQRRDHDRQAADRFDRLEVAHAERHLGASGLALGDGLELLGHADLGRGDSDQRQFGHDFRLGLGGHRALVHPSNSQGAYTPPRRAGATEEVAVPRSRGATPRPGRPRA